MMISGERGCYRYTYADSELPGRRSDPEDEQEPRCSLETIDDLSIVRLTVTVSKTDH